METLGALAVLTGVREREKTPTFELVCDDAERSISFAQKLHVICNELEFVCPMTNDDFKGKIGLPNPHINFDTVMDFFDTLGINLKCEVCFSETFGVQTKEFNGTRPHLVYQNSEDSMRQSVKSFFIARCERCGNTKLFDTDIIEEWIEAKNG